MNLHISYRDIYIYIYNSKNWIAVTYAFVDPKYVYMCSRFSPKVSLKGETAIR